MITQTDDFFDFSKKFYKDPRKELQAIKFINTYLDNPGNRRKFLVEHDNKTIKGILSYSFQDSKNKIFVTATSVNPEFFGQSIGIKLFEKIMDIGEQNKKIILNSEYTLLGEKYLKNKIKKLRDNRPNLLFLEDNEKKDLFNYDLLFNANIDFKNFKKIYLTYLKNVNKFHKNDDELNNLSGEDVMNYHQNFYKIKEKLHEKIVVKSLKKLESKKPKPLTN